MKLWGSRRRLSKSKPRLRENITLRLFSSYVESTLMVNTRVGFLVCVWVTSLKHTDDWPQRLTVTVWYRRGGVYVVHFIDEGAYTRNTETEYTKLSFQHFGFWRNEWSFFFFIRVDQMSRYCFNFLWGAVVENGSPIDRMLRFNFLWGFVQPHQYGLLPLFRSSILSRWWFYAWGAYLSQVW